MRYRIDSLIGETLKIKRELGLRHPGTSGELLEGEALLAACSRWESRVASIDADSEADTNILPVDILFELEKIHVRLEVAFKKSCRVGAGGAYGSVHATKDSKETMCGKRIRKRWVIGELTALRDIRCKKCRKAVSDSVKKEDNSIVEWR